MLRGLTTTTFYADDLPSARAWYADLFGVDAYYQHDADDAPAYVEFRIGDYEHEFGIIDGRFAPPDRATSAGGAMTYWHVDDLQATLDRLVAKGATPHLPPTEHGPGFVTASVIDPFGNVLGVMFNQHYLDIVGARRGA